MGNVQDTGSLSGNNLKPPRKPEIPQACPYGIQADGKVTGQGFQRHQHAGRVLHLPVIIDAGLGQGFIYRARAVPGPGIRIYGTGKIPAGLVELSACFPGAGRNGGRRIRGPSRLPVAGA